MGTSAPIPEWAVNNGIKCDTCEQIARALASVDRAAYLRGVVAAARDVDELAKTFDPPGPVSLHRAMAGGLRCIPYDGGPTRD